MKRMHIHVGVERLEELRARLRSAEMSVFDEGETLCCYARSDKSWVTDPAGIAWEAYKTMEDVQFFAAAKSDKGCAIAADHDRAEHSAPPTTSQVCCG